MKRLGLVVMMGLGGLMLGGCVTGNVPDVAFKRLRLPLYSTDVVNSFEAAKDAVSLLRDSSFSDPGPFENVEVTASSVTVSGFKTGQSTTVGSFGGWTSRVGGIYYTGGSSEAVSVFSEGRNQVAIWLADIAEITIEQRVLYTRDGPADADDLKPRRKAFVCQLVLTNGRVVPFYNEQESYVRRVAAGFSFLTHKPITVTSQYPLAGCVLNANGPVVVEEQLAGPFDMGGIPLGVFVKQIDGKGGNAEQISDALLLLGPGTHTITWGYVGGFGSTLSKITIGEAPDLNMPPPPSKR
jgi:hypothetical protein